MRFLQHSAAGIRSACAFLGVAGLSMCASAQSFPPAWSSGADGYAAGDLVAYNQNYYRAVQSQAKGAIKSLVTPGYWELSELRLSATPMKVGTQTGDTFATFQQAWQYIHNARIDPGATITIVIEQTQPVFTQSLNLDHPFGSQIFIQGASQGPVALKFSGCDGVALDNAHVIGGFSNITLEGTNSSGSPSRTPGTHGMIVSSNAVLNTQNVTVDDFDIGVEAQNGGTLNCGVTGHPDGIENFGTYGVFATDHSLVDIKAPLAIGPNVGLDGQTSAPAGYCCTQGAELKAPGCTAQNCQDQFLASTNGFILATNAVSIGGPNFGNGFHCSYGGTMDATGSSAGGCTWGYYSVHGSKLIAVSTTISSTNIYIDYYANIGSLIEAYQAPSGASYRADDQTVVNALGNAGSYINQANN